MQQNRHWQKTFKVLRKGFGEYGISDKLCILYQRPGGAVQRYCRGGRCAGREQAQHGSPLFPIACYAEDLSCFSVAWHWHEEFEFILAALGPSMWM